MKKAIKRTHINKFIDQLLYIMHYLNFVPLHDMVEELNNQ